MIRIAVIYNKYLKLTNPRIRGTGETFKSTMLLKISLISTDHIGLQSTFTEMRYYTIPEVY